MVLVRSVSLASCLCPAVAKSTAGTWTARSTCYWHVTDQRIQVEKPVLYDMPVQQQCDHDDFGLLHEQICTDCEAMDNPCGGEFMACVGCCEQRESVRSHSCENIKKYFFEKNAKTLKCDERMDLEEGNVNFEYGDDTANREETSGVLKAECAVDVMDAEAEGVPVKLKFDCNNCATQGVPNLLQQCCETALSFRNSDHVRKLQDQGFTVFLWADGCHDRWIGPDDNQVEFQHTYPSLTEKKINQEMHKFIEREYCDKSVKPSTDKCPSGGYRRLMDDPTWQTNSSQFGSAVPQTQFINASRQLNADADCDWFNRDLPGAEDLDAVDGATTMGTFWSRLFGGACALYLLL